MKISVITLIFGILSAISFGQSNNDSIKNHKLITQEKNSTFKIINESDYSLSIRITKNRGSGYVYTSVAARDSIELPTAQFYLTSNEYCITQISFMDEDLKVSVSTLVLPTSDWLITQEYLNDIRNFYLIEKK